MILTLEQANAACNEAARRYYAERNRPFQGWGSDYTNRSKMPWFLETMDRAALLLGLKADLSFCALWGRAMQETGAAWYDIEQKSDADCEADYGYQTSTGRNLGNTQPGDGARYKGRGVIQATGRANYQRAGERMGADFVSNPDLIIEPEYSARFIHWYIVEEMPRRNHWCHCYDWLVDASLSLEERTYRISACINWGFWQPWNRYPAKEQIHGWEMSLVYAQSLAHVLGVG